jgi:hypothetical protein
MGRDKSLNWIHPFMFGLLLAIGTVAGNAEHQRQTICCDKPEREKPAPPLERKALDLLVETSNRLATAETLAFKAVVTDERPNFPAAPLTYRTTSDVLMARPDKLRVITSGDGPFSDFYYDGQMITEFSPARNFAIATTAPPSINDALKAAYNSVGIYFPFTDVILAGRYEDIAECVETAVYLGPSRAFDGTATDTITYTIGGISVQLWIGAQDKLPRMLVVVFPDDPLQLRHQVEFSNWQIDQPVSAEAFNVNNAIFAAQKPVLPSGTQLPMMNTPTTPVR